MHHPRVSPPFVSAVLLALVALAAPAGAQVTEAQAVKLVKDSTKAQAKTIKAVGKSALVTMDAALDAIEVGLTDASETQAVVTDVAGAAGAFLATMNDALTDSINAVDDAATDALQALSNGGDLAGAYPKDLYFGTDGVLDDSRATLLKAVIKVRNTARKRLAQTIKKAETLAGIGLTLRLELPVSVRMEAVNQNIKIALATVAEIDLLVGGSKLDTPADGLLFVGGTSDSTASDVELDVVFGFSIVDSDSASVNVGTHRFSLLLDDGGNGFQEGNYLVGSTQTGSVVDSAGEIGIR